MLTENKKTSLTDLAVAALVLIWFFLPFGVGPTASGATTAVFFPYSFPSGILAFKPFIGLAILAYAAFLVPVFFAYRLAAFFLEGKMGPAGSPSGMPAAASGIVVSSVMIAVVIVPFVSFADSPAWFAAVPPVAILSVMIAAGASVWYITRLMNIINNKNPVYREYRIFRREAKGSRSINVLDVFFMIRSKLFIAFVGIIAIILLSLSVLLLGNYRASIIEAVGDGARSQVDQASTNYRVNLGDSIGLFEYINRQIELNEKAKFSYNSLTLYTNLKKEVYLDELSAGTGDFPAEYSTLAANVQNPELPPLSADKAGAWAAAYAADGAIPQISDGKARTISFASPIVKVDTVRNGDSKIRRIRLLGFSVMTFSVDTIMRPYFRTRSIVLVLTALFLYLAVILTYVIGNYIVNPLLFLRMNVRKISDILTTMIRGQTRISSASLVYNDCITSRDEIKSLSTEISDMVTVIRGIVPYISASTLKQAEKGIASTTRKELAFLFTDIRGFTTLCEGMQPEEVVGVLNRYLDLETEIILNNHGDVDKFVGDEMMAFFEGPQKEENACRAAMQLRHAMMEEKERREKEGLPIVAIGIGINTGDVVFGSVGARDRMDFTSIGDTVNLAARLEGANKAYGSKTIITEAVYERVRETFVCRELDFIAVKGKNEPVRIFEILQQTPLTQPKLLEIKTLFEKGLDAYRARKWNEADKAFRKNVELYGDAPSAIFLERVGHFSQNPPDEDWDGVFRMTVK
jgi:adenylate cyclase